MAESGQNTGEAIVTLGNDVERCREVVSVSFDEAQENADGSIDVDHEFASRQLVRAVFAYVEALAFSVKGTSVQRCLADGIDVSMPERQFSADVDYDLNSKGEVVERRPRVRTLDNLRFALNLLERSRGNMDGFDASVEWWSHMNTALKIRDRLVHPRWPSDVAISRDELSSVLKAYDGFNSHLMSTPEQASAV